MVNKKNVLHIKSQIMYVFMYVFTNKWLTNLTFDCKTLRCVVLFNSLVTITFLELTYYIFAKYAIHN